MSAEKFYRNVRVVRKGSFEVRFPDSVIEESIAGPSPLSVDCRENGCQMFLVVFERGFGKSSGAILPGDYLRLISGGAALSEFRISARIGGISKTKWRECLAVLKTKNAKEVRISRLVKNELVRKALIIHHLGRAARVTLRPTACFAENGPDGLRVEVVGDVLDLQLTE